MFKKYPNLINTANGAITSSKLLDTSINSELLKPVDADSSEFIARNVGAKRTARLVGASMIQFKQILSVIAQESLAIR